jgi:hypothetical protein
MRQDYDNNEATDSSTGETSPDSRIDASPQPTPKAQTDKDPKRKNAPVLQHEPASADASGRRASAGASKELVGDAEEVRGRVGGEQAKSWGAGQQAPLVRSVLLRRYAGLSPVLVSQVSLPCLYVYVCVCVCVYARVKYFLCAVWMTKCALMPFRLMRVDAISAHAR